MVKTIIKIDVDVDLKGLSIATKNIVEVEGVKYEGELHRKAFRSIDLFDLLVIFRLMKFIWSSQLKSFIS